MLALLTQTARLKAAFASAGLYNLSSMYLHLRADGSSRGISGAEEGQVLMGATLRDAPQRFIENSAVFSLPKIATPLLLAHGSSDESTPVTESDWVFVGLRRLGKAVEYVGVAPLASQVVGQRCAGHHIAAGHRGPSPPRFWRDCITSIAWNHWRLDRRRISSGRNCCGRPHDRVTSHSFPQYSRSWSAIGRL